ncbi:MAG: iron ABC transporter permease [Acidobacteria bacterium]|nr:iron ABC transporter permease [Acidobacteriota bacterium]
MKLLRSPKLLWVIPFVFMGLAFYIPLLSVLQLGFGEHLGQGDPTEISVWPVLWFTFWQAAVSTIICLLVGIPAAYIFYRRSFFGSNLLRSIITVPFMLPSLVVAMAVIEFARPFGGFSPVVAIIFANVFANFAVVVRTVGSQWQNIADETEEEAELSGAGRIRTTFKVILPQLATSIRSSSAIIMLYCASSYGIVLSLGGGQINTLETALSITVLQRLDFQHGAALALLQVAFSLVAFTASRWGGANPLSFEPKSAKSKKLDKRDWPAFLFTVLLTFGIVVIPICLVLVNAFRTKAGSFGLENFFLLDSRGYRDLLNISFAEASINSLRNLVVATILSMLIGGIVSYLLAERARQRKSKQTDFIGITLDAAFLLPIGVSAVVLGLGYLVSLSGNLADIRSQWFIVPLVQSVFAIPMVIRVLFPALIAIDDGPREQAMTDGASKLEIFFAIDLRLIRASVKTAVAFSALVSVGEFGVASLLAYADQATIPVLLYQLIARPGNQNFEMALAVAAILTALTTVLVLLVSRESETIRKRRLVS